MRETRLKCERTSKLIIGDPMYLDDIANKRDRGCEKDLVFIRKRMPTDTNTHIVVKEVENNYEYNGKQYSFTSIVVNIVISTATYDTEKTNKFIDTFVNGKYHPSLLKKEGKLGCDTACFSIETNYGYEEFHTGADGYYGYYMIYKVGDIFKIEFSLDTDLFDFDDVVSTMKYLFKEKK